MSRKYNFNPGPSTLPLPVLEKVRDELLDYQGTGMSIVESSHRGPEYKQIHERAVDLIGELLELPAGYRVLFLGGGATMQFSMVPLNFLWGERFCSFTVTGAWAKKALGYAHKAGRVELAFDGAADGYTSLPDAAGLEVDSGSAYLHLTSNETIGGLQWQSWPGCGEVPMVCDMSSDILSRPVPAERFGLIYAGAQKNLGPAGVTLVIISPEMLERCNPDLTAYLSYTQQAAKNAPINTPPVFAVYMLELVLEHLKEQGGVQVAEKRSRERADLLYSAIDESGGFYRSPVARDSRSKMNVVFRLPTEELEQKFIAGAAERNMVGLKGHRSVGGLRASIYNAMPVEGASLLADFMRDFAAANG